MFIFIEDKLLENRISLVPQLFQSRRTRRTKVSGRKQQQQQKETSTPNVIDFRNGDL